MLTVTYFWHKKFRKRNTSHWFEALCLDTPPGEAARLLGYGAGDFEQDRIWQHGQAIATRYNAVLCAKSAGT